MSVSITSFRAKHIGQVAQNLFLTYLHRFKKLPGVVDLRRRYHLERADCVLVSYPKSGRTWLRAMLGRALQQKYQTDPGMIMRTSAFAGLDSRIPRIYVSHDDFPHNKPPEKVKKSKSKYASKRVILLVRDPRDVLVSLYFQKRFRRRGKAAYTGELDQFLGERIGGIQSLIAFYNAWAENRDVPEDLLVVRYEDIVADPTRELRRLLEFLGIDWLPDEIIEESVEFSRFEKLKKVELEGQLNHQSLKTNDAENPEASKVRRGKPGGYVDYLTSVQVADLDQTIQTQLSDFFSYYK